MDVSAGQVYINERLNAIHIQDVYKYNIRSTEVLFENLNCDKTTYTNIIESIDGSFLVKPQGLKTHLILNDFSILEYDKYACVTINTATRKKDRKTKVKYTAKGNIIVSDDMNNYKSKLTPISDQHEEKTIAIFSIIEAMQKLKDKL